VLRSPTAAPYFLQILLTLRGVPFTCLRLRSSATLTIVAPSGRCPAPSSAAAVYPQGMGREQPRGRRKIFPRIGIALTSASTRPFHPIEQYRSRGARVSAGQLHMTCRFRSRSSPASARKIADLAHRSLLETHFFRFNVRRAPLDDPRYSPRSSLSGRSRRPSQTDSSRWPPARTHFHTLRSWRVTLRRHAAATISPPRASSSPMPVTPARRPPTHRNSLQTTPNSSAIVSEAIQQMWHRELGLEVSSRSANQERPDSLKSLSSPALNYTRRGPRSFIETKAVLEGESPCSLDRPTYRRTARRTFSARHVRDR